jgi:hypothetical protein
MQLNALELYNPTVNLINLWFNSPALICWKITADDRYQFTKQPHKYAAGQFGKLLRAFRTQKLNDFLYAAEIEACINGISRRKTASFNRKGGG